MRVVGLRVHGGHAPDEMHGGLHAELRAVGVVVFRGLGLDQGHNIGGTLLTDNPHQSDTGPAVVGDPRLVIVGRIRPRGAGGGRQARDHILARDHGERAVSLRLGGRPVRQAAVGTRHTQQVPGHHGAGPGHTVGSHQRRGFNTKVGGDAVNGVGPLHVVVGGAVDGAGSNDRRLARAPHGIGQRRFDRDFGRRGGAQAGQGERYGYGGGDGGIGGVGYGAAG